VLQVKLFVVQKGLKKGCFAFVVLPPRSGEGCGEIIAEIMGVQNSPKV